MMPEADFLAERQKHYANILNDLFDPTPHMNSIRIFEFVCALVRAGGLELGGFDPWYESKAIIDDMRNLSQLDLPGERFPEPLKTRIRLALLKNPPVQETQFVCKGNRIEVGQGSNDAIHIRFIQLRGVPLEKQTLKSHRPVIH